MSTLYDALKKAEKTQQTQHIEQVKALGKTRRGIPAVVVVLLALLLIFGVSKAAAIRKSALSIKKNANSATSIKTQAANPSNTQQPVAIVKKTYTGYELEGIICNGDSCVAVINGKLLKLQDTISNLIVTKISPQSVELRNSKDDSTKILELKP